MKIFEEELKTKQEFSEIEKMLKAEDKIYKDLERSQFEEFKEPFLFQTHNRINNNFINENNNNINPEQNNEVILCPTCEKNLDINNLEHHECICEICKKNFPSNLLSDHQEVCIYSITENNDIFNDNNNNNNNHNSNNNNNNSNNNNIDRRGININAFLNIHTGRNAGNFPINILNNQTFTFAEAFPSLNKNKPLSKEQINSLPLFPYKSLAPKEEEKCMICMDEFVNEEKVRALTCFHKYHEKCIDSWLKLKGCCPICKQTMDL